MATLKLCKLTVTFLIFAAFLQLFCSFSYGSSPTIAHSSEPFFLPTHLPNCIVSALHSFINKSVPKSTSYFSGSVLETKTVCRRDSHVLLRLRVFNSSGELRPQPKARHQHGRHGHHRGKEQSLRQRYTSLLHEFRATLKLRYEWAVIMNGGYWMEYHVGHGNNSTLNRSVKGMQLANQSGSNVDILDCLPRGDVLVSHNNEAGASSGFDVLPAPHSLVSQNNHFFLLMQGDCNLVLYTAAGLPLWNSRTRGMGTKCSLSLLRDGNLVIANENKHIWASGSSISCSSVFILMMQNDGNAVIYDMLSGVPIWATGTNQ